MADTFRLSVRRTAQVCTRGDAAAPTWWVLLHGYGQRAEDFLDRASALAGDDRLLVAPEALSRFYVDEMDAHRTVGASWMTRAEREHEIQDYVAYLDAVVAHLREQRAEGTEPSLCVLGFSQGAATASRWVLLGEVAVDRLVLWAGDLAHDMDLAAHADRLRALDLTVVVGARDRWIDDDRVQALRDRLAAHEIDATVRTFDGGHRLDDETLQRVSREP